MDSPSRRPRQVVQVVSLQYLVAVPVALAVLTAAALYLFGDADIYMLYSQCHARARLPWLSHAPIIGAPTCFLVSFFREAVAGARAAGLVAPALALVGGLLTVSAVEAARLCNAPSPLLVHPTGPWLAFTALLAGALVWQLVMLPAFFHRSRAIAAAGRDTDGPSDPNLDGAMRHLARRAELVAIPVAVTVGFVAPSVLMLALDDPTAVAVASGIWLLFPVWVSLIRRAVRAAVLALVPNDHDDNNQQQSSWHASFYLESDRRALVAVYAVPVACSAVAHVLLIWSLTRPDDRKEMTRAVTRCVVVEAASVVLTVLYWLLVEAGWRVALAMVATSVVLGPGAGVCVAWILREGSVDPNHRSVTVVAVGARAGSRDGSPSEDTPLLR